MSDYEPKSWKEFVSEKEADNLRFNFSYEDVSR